MRRVIANGWIGDWGNDPHFPTYLTDSWLPLCNRTMDMVPTGMLAVHTGAQVSSGTAAHQIKAQYLLRGVLRLAAFTLLGSGSMVSVCKSITRYSPLIARRLMRLCCQGNMRITVTV